MAINFPASPSIGDQVTADSIVWKYDGEKWVTVRSLFDRGVISPGTAAAPGLPILGDPDTGIFSPGANSLAITTAGTQHVTVDSSGNVGIGITSPTGRVHAISGTNDNPHFYFKSDQGGATNNAGDLFKIEHTRGSGNTSALLNVLNGGGSVFYVEGSGNVGIGTSSPSVSYGNGLHIASDNAGLKLQNTVDTGWAYVEFTDESNTTKYIQGYRDSTGSYAIRPGDSLGVSSGLTLDSSGNVGIANTSPTANLEIGTALGSTTSIRLNSATSDYLKFSSENAIAYIIAAHPTTGGAELGFKTGGSNGTDAMRIDSEGNLGIGATSIPANFRVEIAEPGNVGLNLRNTNNSAGDKCRIAFSQGSGNTTSANTFADIIVTAATVSPLTGTIQIRTNEGNSLTQKMLIDSAGILFSQPTYSDTTANGANVVVASNGRFSRSTSSAKYKTNIETLQDSYADALLACRPVWYQSTCKGDNPDHGWWGFIAEEIAEIDPRLVQWKTTKVTHDENGSAVETSCDPEVEGVSYDRFVPHLLNLIKRQQAAIKTLETKVASLEAS